MGKQISIRWDNSRGEDYEASVQALDRYVPAPSTTVSMKVKGDVSPAVVEKFAKLASRHHLELGVTLTATWPENEGQLRLFPPPARLPEGVTATVETPDGTEIDVDDAHSILDQAADVVGNSTVDPETGEITGTITDDIFGDDPAGSEATGDATDAGPEADGDDTARDEDEGERAAA